MAEAQLNQQEPETKMDSQNSDAPDSDTTTENPENAVGVDITPEKDGGVLKEIKTEGSIDEQPIKGDEVFVHYVGKLTDGTVFDSSRDRGEQFKFTLGTGQVIKAWDLGVASMKRGELAVLTCKSAYAYGEQGSPPKIPPNATLVFEVELFDFKGEDLSEKKDGGVLRRILEEGVGFDHPNDYGTVDIHIKGKHNSRVFEDRDISFAIGEGSEVGIVPGVEQALRKFKSRETSQIKISSHYAYGIEGHKEYNIPADADLEYEIKLVRFEKAKESWELNGHEKIEQAEIGKAKGTIYFKQSKYVFAIQHYKRILDYLGDDSSMTEEEQAKKKSLLLAAHLNLAMCYLKKDDNVSAREHCDKALEEEPGSEKALFRRGTTYANTQDFELAMADFKAVIEIDPNNKAAKNQLVLMERKVKAIQDKEKKLYAGMFQKFADIDAKNAPEEPENKSAENGEQSSESAEEISMEAEEVSAVNGTAEKTEQGAAEAPAGVEPDLPEAAKA